MTEDTGIVISNTTHTSNATASALETPKDRYTP